MLYKYYLYVKPSSVLRTFEQPGVELRVIIPYNQTVFAPYTGG